MNGRMAGLCDLVDLPISATSVGKNLLSFFFFFQIQSFDFSAKVLIFEVLVGLMENWEGIMGCGFWFLTLGFMCILGFRLKF